MKAWENPFNTISILFMFYCRLRDLGVSKRVAGSLCKFYESAVFRHLWSAPGKIRLQIFD